MYYFIKIKVKSQIKTDLPGMLTLVCGRDSTGLKSAAVCVKIM